MRRISFSFAHIYSHLRRLNYFAFLTILSLAPLSLAGPEGGEVVGGEGSISHSGNTTTINQATERMAIDWQSYNLGANESVKYLQPDASSISLNRILSYSGSQIHGRIDANGHVILVNPNGIYFGENATVNAGGLIASGLAIDPNDFMNGDFAFSALDDTDGVVINGGLLNASLGGNIALIGQRVENSGMISAQLGSVNLASGKEAIVTFDGEGLLGVRVTREVMQNDLGVDAAVLNSGEISAEDGQILISASVSQDIFSNAVNSGGISDSRSVVVHEDGSFTLGAGADVVNTGTLDTSGEVGGEIVLLGENVANNGDILANGEIASGAIEVHSRDTNLLIGNARISAQSRENIGGDIKLLGQNVGLMDSAQVNASGYRGGGQVLVGGDKTGANPLVRNAEFIYLSADSKVDANALFDGDGGKIIGFAEHTARFFGGLSAQGGINGGKGGFIETSGLRGLHIENAPSTSAPGGEAGLWLIDPFDITISGIDFNDDDFNSADNPFVASATESELAIGTILIALNNNNNVEVRTANSRADNPGVAGDITLSGSIQYTDSHDVSLTLNAHGSILTNTASPIEISSSDGKLDVNLIANFQPETDGMGTVTSVGDIDAADLNLRTRGGDVTATNNSGGIITLGSIFTFAANNENGGAVNLTSSGTITTGDINTRNGTHTQGDLNGGSSVSNVRENLPNNAGDVTLTATDGDIVVGNIFANGVDGNDPSDNACGSNFCFTGGAGGDGGTVMITSDSGAVSVISIDASGGDGDAAAGANGGNDIGPAGDAGSVTVTAATTITLGSVDTQGNVSAFGGIFGDNNPDNRAFVAVNGASAPITLSGDIVLANDSEINAARRFAQSPAGPDYQLVEPPEDTDSDPQQQDETFSPAAISIGGVNGTTDGTENLIVIGSEITISGNTGDVVSLGDLTLITRETLNDVGTETSAPGLINASSNSFAVGSFSAFSTPDPDVSSDGIPVASFVSGDITTGGVIGGGADGSVRINSASVLTTGDIITRGQDAAPASDQDGTDGGVIELDAAAITVGELNVSGGNGDGTGAGGDAGTISVIANSATTSSITVAGDINTEGGIGSTNGTGTSTTLELAGSGDGTLILVPSASDQETFFTSSFTVLGTGDDVFIGPSFGMATSYWTFDSATTGNIVDDPNVMSPISVSFSGFDDISGGDEADEFRVHDTIDVTLEMKGGGGEDAIVAGNRASPNWQITDLLTGSGSVFTNNVFSGIETLRGYTAADGSGHVDEFQIPDTGVFGDLGMGFGSFDGGGGTTDKVTGGNRSSQWVVNADGSVSVDGIGGSITNVELLEGNDDTDTLTLRAGQTLNGSSSSSGGFAAVNFDGAGGTNDAVVGGQQATAWVITGANNTGTVTGLSGTFTNVESLSGSSIAGALASDYIDTFQLSEINQFVGTIDGGVGDQDKIIAGDINTTWTVLSATQFTVVGEGNVGNVDGQVSNVEILEGNDSINNRVDQFILLAGSEFSGSFNGMAGNDTVTAGATDTEWTISGVASGTTDTMAGTFSNIENLQGDATSGVDIFNINAVFSGDISGQAGNDIFNINAVFSGDISGQTGNDIFNINADVTGVGALQGGAGDDDFNINIASLTTTPNGGEGSDDFFILAPSVDAVIDGGANTGGADRLIAYNDTTNDTDWIVNSTVAQLSNKFSNPSAGQLDADIKVDFSNIETLEGQDGVDNFLIDNNFLGTLIGGDGLNIFDLNANVTAVVGGESADTFNVQETIQVSIQGGGPAANPGGDILNLDDPAVSVTWLITGAGAGTLNGGVGFSGIENLNGSDGGNDSFSFQLPANESFGGNINARGGNNDRVLVSATGTYVVSASEDLNGIANIETIENDSGNSAGYILQLASNPARAGEFNDWTIDGANAGSITERGTTNSINFIGFASIFGNEANDVFDVTSGSITNVSGIVSSSSLVTDEVNELVFDHTPLAGNEWRLTGEHTGTVSNSSNLINTFTSIQSLMGSGNDSLTGRDQANTWTLLGTDSTVESAQSDSDKLTFNGFVSLTGGNGIDEFLVSTGIINTLVGGEGNDIFRLQAGGSANSIDGGTNAGGNDQLVGLDTANTWSLGTTNSLANGSGTYVTSFSNIEQLDGTDVAIDNFAFSNFQNFIINAGTNDDDVVSYAAITGQNVSVTIGGSDGDSGVDRYIGNHDDFTGTDDDSSLEFISATGQTVTWDIEDIDAGGSLSDGIDDGTINNDIEFVNFNNLLGSNGNDIFTFDQTGGNITALTGEISGGANNGSVGDHIVGPVILTNWSVAPASPATEESFTYFSNFIDTTPLPFMPPVLFFATTEFSGIETISAGPGNDIFNIGDASANITLNAGAGDDVLNLPDADISITLGNPVGGLTLNEFETITGNALRNNQLTVASSNGTVVRWTIDGENAGEVQIGISGPTTDFVNFQTLIGGDGDDIFDFSTSTAGSVERPATDNGLIDGGADGLNEIIGRPMNNRWLLDGDGQPNSVVDIDSGKTYVESFINIQKLTGSSNDDDFRLRANGTFDGTVDGGLGDNSLQVETAINEVTNWLLLDSDPLILDKVERVSGTSPATASIDFENIAQLIGGAGVDNFIYLTDAMDTRDIDADDPLLSNTGVDSVDLSNIIGAVSVTATAGNVSGVDGVERVIGNGASSTLNGSTGGTNTWTISEFATAVNHPNLDGVDDGQIAFGSTTLEFINFANLAGSADQVDEFIIADTGSVLGAISGGTPALGTVEDSLELQDDNQFWELTGSNSGSVEGNNFSEIETIISSGSGDSLFANVTEGSVRNNIWQITSLNNGTVRGQASGTITFEGMENLIGNAGDDSFELPASNGVSGNIVATRTGTGLVDSSGDTLSVNSAPTEAVIWTIDTTTGSVTPVGGNFSGFENLEGGNGRDTVNVVSDFSGQISTGAQDDTITLSANITGGLFAGADNDAINIAASTLTTNVNGEDGTDTIEVTHNQASNWLIDTNGSVDGVSFSGIERAVGNNQVDTVIVNTTFFELLTNGGNDVITLAQNVAGGVNSGDGDDRINIANTGLLTAIDGGDNNDTIAVTHAAASNWNINTTSFVDSVRFTNVESVVGNDTTDDVDINIDLISVDTQGGNDVIAVAANVGTLATGEGNDQITVSADGLNINLDAELGSDSLVIAHTGQSIWVLDTSSTVDNISFSGVESITGGDGVDQITVNSLFGTIITSDGNDIVTAFANIASLDLGLANDILNIATDGIAISADGGAGNDQINTTHTDNSTWNIAAASNVDNVDFSGFEIANAGDGVDNFTVDAAFGSIDAGGGNDTITLNQNVATGVFAGDGNDLIVLTDELLAMTIDGEGDNDTLRTDHTVANTWTLDTVSTVNNVNFVGVETVIGNDDVDSIDVLRSFGSISTAGGEDIIRIATDNIIANLDAGAGSDTLNITHGTASDWLIDTVSTVDGITFTGIENIFGNDAIDTITVNTAIAQISTQGGTDVVSLNAGVAALSLGAGNDIANIGTDEIAASVFGDLGDDEIIITHSGPSDWAINANPSVDNIVFSGFTVIRGNNNIDTIDVDTAFDQIFAGGGNDEITLNANVVDVFMGGGNDTVNIDASGLTTVIDGGNGNNDQLVITHSVNSLWEIDGTNTVDGISFSNFESLQGNNAVDVFNVDVNFNAIDTAGGNDIVSTSSDINDLVLGAGNDLINIAAEGVDISVDGGDDSDTISIQHAANSNWNIDATPTVDNVSFDNFEIAEGNAAVDTVVLATSFGQINSGAGNDTFTITATGDITAAINAGDDNDTLNLADRSNVLLVGDDNTLNATVDFLGFENFIGNDGEDSIELQSGTIDGNIDGGNGDNQLTVSKTELVSINWTLDGENQGDVTGVVGGFTNFANLVGGAAQDLFVLNNDAAEVSGSIDGAGGTGDQLSVVRAHDAVGRLQWNISGVNQGEVVDRVPSFSNIENLAGGEGRDTFTFTDIAAEMFGLINGGETLAVGDPEDQLDVQVFTGGVVVELGSAATPGSLVNDTDTLPNVNAYNMETVTAAPGANDAGEENNWLALQHLDNVRWVVQPFNRGFVEKVDEIRDPIDDEVIANTRTDFDNFGSIQGGSGDERSNIETDVNITGENRPGTGLRSVIRSDVPIDKLVVVEISEKIINVEGNNNTLLRIDEESAFNGDNTFIIDGNNSGAFEITYFPDFTGFTFTGVNKLEGGSGDDTFIFRSNAANGTSGNLIDGYIKGGAGLNVVSVTDTSTDLSFGLNRISATPVPASDIGSTFPLEGVGDIFEVVNRPGLIDLAGIDSLTSTSAAQVSLQSADDGQFVWGINPGGVVNTLTDIINASTFNFSGVDSISGGGADDTFNLLALDIVDDNFDGGAGTDTVDVSALASSLGISLNPTQTVDVDILLANIENLTANENDHTLYANNLINTWQINTLNGGTLTFDPGTGQQSLAFSNIANVQGGTDVDSFIFSNNSAFSGTFSGGTGSAEDVADYSNITTDFEIVLNSPAAPVIKFAEIERVIGNNDGNANETRNSTLTVASGASLWSIDGINSGNVNTDATDIIFDDFNILVGSDGLDTFDFNGTGRITGSVDGGVNALATDLDSVDIRDVGSALTVAVSGATFGNLNIFGIELIQATGVGNQLVAASGVENTWTVSGENSGDLNSVLQFTGFDSLTGNSLNDQFILSETGSIGNIDGLAGSDTLSVATPVGDPNDQLVWTITSVGGGDVATRVTSFASIENLVGGQGADLFNLANDTSLIEGLIDGGEASAATDPNSDVIRMEAYLSGVIVELGPDASFDSELQEFNYPRVNANNIESLIAAAGIDNAGEDQNWIAITHDKNVNWVGESLNNGYVEEVEFVIDPIEDQVIPNTRTNYQNFGSFVGGIGDEESNLSPGNNITGEARPGSGLRSLDYSTINGLVVVDISDKIIRLTGNDNTLLRVADGSDFNGANNWTIDGGNSGNFAAAYIADYEGFEFSGVNQLQGGTGNDTFNFTQNIINGTTGGLTNGFINGGGGDDRIVVTNALGNLVFGASRQQDEALMPSEIITSFPANDLPPVFLVDNRTGVVDIANVEQLSSDGTAITRLISAADGEYTWVLGAASGNTLTDTLNNVTLSFSGISEVGGGAADDTINLFALSSVANNFDGGDGTDAIDFSAISDALAISLNASIDSVDVQISDIENLLTSGNGDTLYGSSFENTWVINALNAGSITFTENNITRSLAFQNISHLVGGDLEDSFQIIDAGRIEGSINGGVDVVGNNDSLTVAASSTNEFIFQMSTLSSTGNVIDNGSDRIDLFDIEILNAESSTSLNDTLIGLVSAANTWVIASSNTLTSSAGSDTLIFSGIENLQGGNLQDAFVFDGAIVSGLVDGGANTSDVSDTLAVQNLDNQTVHVGNRVSGDINVINIEQVVSSGNNQTLRGNDTRNTWQLNNTDHRLSQQEDSGLVSDIVFNGFANLLGGSASDTFVFNEDQATAEINTIDGGVSVANSLSNTDALDLTRLQTAKTVSLDLNAQTADLYVSRIENIQARNAINLQMVRNQIIGNAEENTWTITGQNSGSINAVTFSGFADLTGNSDIDRFIFEQADVATNVGITGIIRGNDGIDEVSTVGLSTDVSLALNTQDLADIRVIEVENIVANTDPNFTNTLFGELDSNSWQIAGTNSGIVDGVSFSGFANLVGGDQTDSFVFDGVDIITGLLDGRGGESDNVDLLALTNSAKVGLGINTTADIQLINIESVQASDSGNEIIGANEDSTWTVLGTDSGTVVSETHNVAFQGFANLTGGSASDVFNLNRAANIDDTVSGVIHGGDGQDSVNIDGLLDLTAIGVGSENEATLNIIGIENLVAVQPNSYRLIGANIDNIWRINGTDAGEVASLSFDGFAFLVGGSANDTFILGRPDGATQDDRITGSIDGGANPAVGTVLDVLELEGLQNPVTVSFDDQFVADLYVSNINAIRAAESTNNTLVGGNTDNAWDIDGVNQGDVNNVTFSGFRNLIGRDQVDTFRFSDLGSVTGFIDGGNQPDGLRDIVDMSALSVVDVLIGDATSGFLNIEQYQGRANGSILRAANVENNWAITGIDSGTIVDENNNNIAFIDFDILQGGSDVDRFTLAGGSISGEIRAGEGNDLLTVDLGNGISGEVSFKGNQGNDRINIVGGADGTRFDSTFELNSSQDQIASLAYEIDLNETTRSYRVNYDEVETIDDRVYSSILNINSTVGVDDLVIVSGNAFRFNQLAAVNYLNKNSISVNGNNGDQDQLTIDGIINLDNTFSVVSAAVDTSDSNALIDAGQQILFNNTGAIGGGKDDRLRIQTAGLVLNSVKGDVYITQTGDLTLAGMEDPEGIVDIAATGTISDAAALTSQNDVIFTSNADIVLDNDNSLSGALTFNAANGNVTLTNGLTKLADVSARNLTINTDSSVDDEGLINIAGTSIFNAGTSSVIVLDNNANNFGRVQVLGAGSFLINEGSENGLEIEGNVTNSLTVSTLNSIIANPISAEDVILNSSTAAVSVQGAINAQNSVVITANDVDINAGIAVAASAAQQAISIDAQGGTVQIKATIDATEALPGNILIKGEEIVQEFAGQITGKNIQLDGGQIVELQANISAAETLSINAASGEVNMQNATGQTLTTAQQVFVNANNNVNLQQIEANEINVVSQNGDVVLQADISAANEFTADSLNGSFDIVDSAKLSVNNGDVDISSGSVDIAGGIETLLGSIVIDTSGSTLLSGNSLLDGLDITITSSGLIAMSGNASINANDAINLTSGGDISLVELNTAGTVSLTSGGAIFDNNDLSFENGVINIFAENLIVRSQAGVGGSADNPNQNELDLSISSIDLINQTGTVQLENNRDLEVSAIINNGDIFLKNTRGTVTLVSDSTETYSEASFGSGTARGIIDAGYNSGAVNIIVENTAPDVDLSTVNPAKLMVQSALKSDLKPELVGRTVDIVALDGFGIGGQRFVVYANNLLKVTGNTLKPIFAFGNRPDQFETIGDLIDPTVVSSVSDLLVEVESIDEIDPAIFTEVRNYAYDNISIRMPRDQLYEDEYEDEEEEEAF